MADSDLAGQVWGTKSMSDWLPFDATAAGLWLTL